MSQNVSDVYAYTNGVKQKNKVSLEEIKKFVKAEDDQKQVFSLRLRNDYGFVDMGVAGSLPNFGGNFGVVCINTNSTLTAYGSHGICHGNLNSINGRHHSSVIVSLPFTGRDRVSSQTNKFEKIYPKGFLDDYYTWLTEESPVRDVFLEKWSGEFLYLDSSASVDMLLLALILSRFPCEQSGSRGGAPVWLGIYNKCKSFAMSIAIVNNYHLRHNVIVDGRNVGVYAPQENGAATGAHSPLCPSTISKDGLYSWLTCQNINEIKRPHTTNTYGPSDHTLPYNQPNTGWYGVFNIYNVRQGDVSVYQQLSGPYIKGMGIKDSNPGAFNNVRTYANPKTQDETDDFCIEFMNNHISSYSAKEAKRA